jgi:hypothetical protein
MPHLRKRKFPRFGSLLARAAPPASVSALKVAASGARVMPGPGSPAHPLNQHGELSTDRRPAAVAGIGPPPVDQPPGAAPGLGRNEMDGWSQRTLLVPQARPSPTTTVPYVLN